MDETSARLHLPLLTAAQAQKETTHNEALALIDLALHPAVAEIGIHTPPPAPTVGDAWIIGIEPTGAWVGRQGMLAGWTNGGWRYVRPVEGMAVCRIEDGMVARFVSGAWHAATATVPEPTGGTTIDAESRTAIAVIVAVLRLHGLSS